MTAAWLAMGFAQRKREKDISNDENVANGALGGQDHDSCEPFLAQVQREDFALVLEQPSHDLALGLQADDVLLHLGGRDSHAIGRTQLPGEFGG